jgi:FAD/FMN-containing dehydrogenase
LASDDLRITSWSRQLTENLHRVNEELGLARDHVYMGDAGEWQNPFDSFPEASVDRMRTIRAAYDPSGTFSRLNWGGFKLGH